MIHLSFLYLFPSPPSGIRWCGDATSTRISSWSVSRPGTSCWSRWTWSTTDSWSRSAHLPAGPSTPTIATFGWTSASASPDRTYFFFFFRTTIKIIAKKRKDAPETVSYPLSNQFQRRLGTVDLFHRHVEVVHERDQNFTAHRHVNTLGPFLEPALHYVLKY